MKTMVNGIDVFGAQEIMNDYGKIKNRLYVRVFPGDYEPAESDIVTKRIEDIVMVCSVRLVSDDNVIASIPITERVLARLGMTADEVFRDALKSSAIIEPAIIIPLHSMIGLRQQPGELMLSVLTNHSGQHGAAVMFYDGFVAEIANKLGRNLFILPSSIHEVLLLQDTGDLEIDALEQMVRDINASVVSEEERLSDEVWYYNREDNRLGHARNCRKTMY